MLKKIKFILISVICIFAFSFSVFAESVPTQKNYTYSNAQKAIIAPESYKLTCAIAKDENDNNLFSNISSVATFEDKLYALDTDNNSIVVINEKYEVEKIICKEVGLNQPQGFFISDKGFIYIADTNNGRIVKTDLNGKLICTVNKPQSKNLTSTVEFLPIKIVVDDGERLYIIVKDETNGIYQMNIDGDFLGFFGSVPVVPSWSELFWRSISTKEQLARMLLFVPTEYSSMDIDMNGFIYTTTSTNSPEEMDSFIKDGGSDSTLAPIRKLNPKNIDVMKRTGSMPPAGDTITSTSKESANSKVSRFVDISIKNNGIYCALDSANSRIFIYNKNGELLFIFGNASSKKNGFNTPNSVCWWNNNIVVSDNGNNSVKIFSPTEYAKAMLTAVEMEGKGKYEEAAKAWEKVLNLHPGNGLAYLGVGKQEMRAGNYSEAMEWFKKAESQKYYSKALELYRQQIGITYIGVAFVALIILLVAVLIIKKYYAKTNKVSKISQNKTFRAVKYGFYIMRHPFDGFENMEVEGNCTVKSATIVLSGLVFLNVIGSFATGYIISGNSKITESILIKGFFGIVLPFALWCIANWSVTSLMNGSGTFKRIYMYSCYSLMPLLILMPILIISSHFVTLNEVALYNIVNMLFYIWVGFLLFCGTIVIHQYTASRTIATIFVIIIAMGIIIFLALLCVTILQQVTEFLKLLFEEIMLRL